MCSTKSEGNRGYSEQIPSARENSAYSAHEHSHYHSDSGNNPQYSVKRMY